MILSPRAQKLLAAQRTFEFPYLIKVTQAGYADMYFANSSDNVLYGGNIFNAASFSIQPPDLDGAKVGNASLTMSAIDQYWIQRIRETQIPAQLQFVAVIVYDEYGIMGFEPLEENVFALRDARWDEALISWDMAFDERQASVITSVKCTPHISPGCA